MLSNLFSIFDPGMGFGHEKFFLFWVVCYFFTVPVVFSRFVESVRGKLVFGLLSGYSVSMVKGAKVLGVGVLCGLFMLLVAVNLFGLVPWVFSLSSHLIFSVTLGFPLWLATFIMSCGMLYKKLSGLVGSGLPLFLAPVIGIIEVASQIIRPVTLSVRLVANMMAGHIIVGLLLGSMLMGSLFLVVLVVGIYLFEMAICIVQAYVFVLLLSIYVRE